jgi:hypothetical protein
MDKLDHGGMAIVRWCAGSMLLLLIACQQKVEQDSADKAARQSPPSPRAAVTMTDWEMAENREQVPFCLPVPKGAKGEYVRDHKADLPRGSVAFNHKTRKSDTIEIRGLLRSDSSVKIADYFRNTYAGAEESGKIIEEKKLIETRGVFHARGYWSNRIYEQRFIEVTWLRKDDVVTYTAHFAVSELPVWQARLDVLLAHDSQCRD